MTKTAPHGRERKACFGTVAAVAAVLSFMGVAQAADDFDSASGYRVANYRSPVTRAPQGGVRVDLKELDRLRGAGAVLVDVMPARAGFDPATGVWRLVEPRRDIPGSIWLPNTGYGRLDPALSAYLDGGLRRATNGNPQQPLVFYCMADCWMSWNAVKRAASLGYSHVAWFSEGTDGWVEAGRELTEARPPPVPIPLRTQ